MRWNELIMWILIGAVIVGFIFTAPPKLSITIICTGAVSSFIVWLVKAIKRKRANKLNRNLPRTNHRQEACVPPPGIPPIPNSGKTKRLTKPVLAKPIRILKDLRFILVVTLVALAVSVSYCIYLKGQISELDSENDELISANNKLKQENEDMSSSILSLYSQLQDANASIANRAYQSSASAQRAQMYLRNAEFWNSVGDEFQSQCSRDQAMRELNNM